MPYPTYTKDELKAKVRPLVVPTGTAALALIAAFLYGKTKGATYVITTHSGNGESSTEVGRI